MTAHLTQVPFDLLWRTKKGPNKPNQHWNEAVVWMVVAKACKESSKETALPKLERLIGDLSYASFMHLCLRCFLQSKPLLQNKSYFIKICSLNWIQWGKKRPNTKMTLLNRFLVDQKYRPTAQCSTQTNYSLSLRFNSVPIWIKFDSILISSIMRAGNRKGDSECRKLISRGEAEFQFKM